MSYFHDGPAAGQHLMLRRAPIMLRVVMGPRGKLDALDQLEDTPEPHEAVHVYVMQGQPSAFHLSCRGKGRGASGYYQDGNYLLSPEQPPDDLARDNGRWGDWAEEHGPRLREWAQAQSPVERPEPELRRPRPGAASPSWRNQ